MTERPSTPRKAFYYLTGPYEGVAVSYSYSVCGVHESGCGGYTWGNPTEDTDAATASSTTSGGGGKLASPALAPAAAASIRTVVVTAALVRAAPIAEPARRTVSVTRYVIPPSASVPPTRPGGSVAVAAPARNALPTGNTVVIVAP